MKITQQKKTEESRVRKRKSVEQNRDKWDGEGG
jgi:hypothetical protein